MKNGVTYGFFRKFDLSKSWEGRYKQGERKPRRVSGKLTAKC
jgi:hypothetical protein